MDVLVTLSRPWAAAMEGTSGHQVRDDPRPLSCEEGGIFRYRILGRPQPVTVLIEDNLNRRAAFPDGLAIKSCEEEALIRVFDGVIPPHSRSTPGKALKHAQLGCCHGVHGRWWELHILVRFDGIPR